MTDGGTCATVACLSKCDVCQVPPTGDTQT